MIFTLHFSSFFPPLIPSLSPFVNWPLIRNFKWFFESHCVSAAAASLPSFFLPSSLAGFPHLTPQSINLPNITAEEDNYDPRWSRWVGERASERASELQKPFFLYLHPHRKRGCWRGIFVSSGLVHVDIDKFSIKWFLNTVICGYSDTFPTGLNCSRT